jgi:hypothetical protein
MATGAGASAFVAAGGVEASRHDAVDIHRTVMQTGAANL